MTDSNIFDQDSGIRRPSLLPGKPAQMLGQWLARLISRHVPAGYEDETGFHFGTDFQSRQSPDTGSRFKEIIALPEGDVS